MMKQNLLAGLMAACLRPVPAPSTRLPSRDIRIEGIQRTEAGTVFSYPPVKVGDTLTNEKASQAIKALFATGFFKDVRMEVENDVPSLRARRTAGDRRPSILSASRNSTRIKLKKPCDNGIAEGGSSTARLWIVPSRN